MTLIDVNDFVADDQYNPYFDASNPTDDDPTPAPVPQPGQTNTPKPRYRILSARDAFLPRPATEWILKQFLERGTVTAIYGNPGCGKTYAVIDLIVCVARNERWLEFDTVQCNILIIDEESGELRMMRRLEETLRGHGGDGSEPIWSISYARFDLANKSDIQEVITRINMGNIGLVVIDALSDIAPNRDENATKEMKPIMLNLRYIAEETQAAIILIHHANKQGGYRGATTIKGDVDIMIKLENEKGVLTFTSEKMRDGAPVTFSALTNFMNIDPKMFWLTTTAAQAPKKAYKAGEDYVLRYLLANGTSTSDDIKDNSLPFCQPKTAQNAIGTLLIQGLLFRVNRGGKGILAEYELTQNGQKEAKNL